MILFRRKQKEIRNINSIIQAVRKNNFSERCCLFILGVYISNLAFNLFFAPYNVVTGGSTGLSIIVENIWGIDKSIFVFLFSLVILILSYFTLGKEMVAKTIFGIILSPIFLKATEVFVNYIDLSNTSMLALMIYGGILSGFGSGLIIKTGFSTGGFQSLYQIMNKYFKISIGNASMLINTIIIGLGMANFGVAMSMYAVVALYISSIVTDRVLLGISDSKAFYIVTSKNKEVSQFIMDKLGHSVTLLDAKGGYTNSNKKVILCVLPTREYSFMKEVIFEIDKNAFFLITDAYEVHGGI